MDLGLRGKAAVVSGSTAGIGLAIATALAAEGAKVVVNGRTEARVAAALDKIRQRVANAELRGVAADLGTANGVDAFLKQVTEADILVNNLGIFEVKPFAEIRAIVITGLTTSQTIGVTRITGGKTIANMATGRTGSMRTGAAFIRDAASGIARRNVDTTGNRTSLSME
jgi:NAD(P)-dependent dehydrogenase (short-subunit alcohol dehydrogenase family)